MANNFLLELDTTPPTSPVISIENGSPFATQQLVDAYISVGDAITTGYQMKIWGDVDTTNDTNVQATEIASSWVSFAAIKQVKLSATDAQKTLYLKIRDDVYNESAQSSDTITLDTTKPVVTTTQPDRSRISKIAGVNVASFSFTVDTPFVEYEVKVVSISGASRDTGTLIATTSGSTNTSGVGSFDTSVTPINVSITGTDLETASAGDGDKIIKVFAFDGGNWYV